MDVWIEGGKHWFKGLLSAVQITRKSILSINFCMQKKLSKDNCALSIFL
jgi:hypothetical protein